MAAAVLSSAKTGCVGYWLGAGSVHAEITTSDATTNAQVVMFLTATSVAAMTV